MIMAKMNFIGIMFVVLSFGFTFGLKSSKSTEEDNLVDSISYEVIGMGAHADNDNVYTRPFVVRSSRQRRSPHIGKWGGGGYHHGVQPYYPGSYGHHGYYNPSSSLTNSHSHAQAISAQFGGKDWGAGFSGSSASAGSGSQQHGHGFRRK